MKKTILIAVAFLFSHVILLAQDKPDKELIIKEIQAKDKKLAKFIQQSLGDSIAKLFSPNCHFIPEYGKIFEGREQVLDFFTSQFKSGVKVSDIKMNPLEHRVYDEIILELGTVDIKFTSSSDQKVVKKQYNYLINWKVSKKGKYRIRAATWNSVDKN